MQMIAEVTLLVPDYDEGIRFYCDALGFELVEDTELSAGKRWVLVAPPRTPGTRLLLAKATTAEQTAAIGNQAGGRVLLFLYTSNFERDHARFLSKGVQFLEEPRTEKYGLVAVFSDPFGNKWDLIQPMPQK